MGARFFLYYLFFVRSKNSLSMVEANDDMYNRNANLTPLAEGTFQNEVYEAIVAHSNQNLVRKGVNECMKQAKRNNAALVVIAADTQPIEIVLSLPGICEEYGVPYIFVGSKDDLARKCGLSKQVASCVVLSSEHTTLSNMIARIKVGIDKNNL